MSLAIRHPRVLLALASFTLVACASAAEPAHRGLAAPAPAGREPSASAERPQGPPPSKPHPSARVPASDAARPAPPARFDALVFDRLLDVSVLSIAVGMPPKVAVLADAPYVFDGRRFVRRELPGSLRVAPDETERVAIFFGRDNEPRIMGTRLSASGRTRPVYLRHRPSGWRHEPSELGPLASAPAGLYGLLGHADPEIVCSPGLVCLVKRVSGWARMEADSAPTALFLTSRGVYKPTGTQLLRLEGRRWEVTAAAFTLAPESLCHRTDDELWLTARGAVRIRRGDGADLETVSTPLESPRAVHCAGERSVWVVGDDGAGHFDGVRWSVVPGDLGRLHLVTGRGPGDIWLAGERGVFRGRPPGG